MYHVITVVCQTHDCLCYPADTPNLGKLDKPGKVCGNAKKPQNSTWPQMKISGNKKNLSKKRVNMKNLNKDRPSAKRMSKKRVDAKNLSKKAVNMKNFNRKLQPGMQFRPGTNNGGG
jgi:hypothetical protein